MDAHGVKTLSLDKRVLGTEGRGLPRASFPKKEYGDTKQVSDIYKGMRTCQGPVIKLFSG